MNREQAIASLKRIRHLIRQEPDKRVQHLVTMADIYLALRYYSAATMVCRAALKLNPLHAPTLLRLGRALLGQDQATDAFKLYTALTTHVPSCSQGWWGLWAACRRLGHHRRAGEALEKLIIEGGDEAENARIKAAEAYASGGDPDRASQLLDESREADSPSLLIARGRLHTAAGRPSRGLVLFERVLEKNSTNPELAMEAAEAASKIGDWASVVRFASTRLETGRMSLRALELLGKARMELENHDEAILALERLTDHAPDNLEYRIILAEALFRADDLEEARREYGRCLARDPHRPLLTLRLAEIAWKRNQRTEAEQYYERTLAQDPGSTLALLRLGCLKYERHAYAEALSCFRRLMVAQPENLMAHLYLGRTLRLTGSFEKSRNHLERARQLAPRSAEAEFELGLLDLELHRTHLARQHFERAQRLNPEGDVGKRAAYELTHLADREDRRRRAAVGESPISSPKTETRPPKTRRKEKWIRLC